MKQQNHYNEALAYLRDYCLRHGRLMHYDRGAMLEAEGTAAHLFGYVESGSIHYLVRNYEGGESTVETVAAGDLVGCYPYCLDGDAAPVTIRADKPCTVRLVSGQQLNQHFLQSKKAAQMALQFLNYRFAQLQQIRRQYYFTHQIEEE